MRKYLAAALISFAAVSFSAASCPDSIAAGKSVFGLFKKKKAAEPEKKKKLTDYEKIFDKKKVETFEGAFKVHKVENKVFAEFPDTVMGQAFRLCSFVEKTSNLSYSTLGDKIGVEINIVVSRTDSLLVIRNLNAPSVSNDPNISEALRGSKADAILFSFPIKTFSPDSSLVADITDLFIGDNLRLVQNYKSFGLMAVSGDYQRSKSFLKSLSASSGRIDAVVTRTYDYGESNVTVDSRTVIMALPSVLMKPKKSSPKIGTSTVSVTSISAMNGAEKVSYACRWNLENRKEPIVFYVDTLLAPVMQRAFADGFSIWNKAFREAGYEDVLECRPYPKSDTSFSPYNVSANCIRFYPDGNRNITVSTGVDRRTGEILSVNMNVSGDFYSQMVIPDAMLYMGAYLPEARSVDLPESLLYDFTLPRVLKAIGTGLGFSVNHAASSAYSNAQLRDPEFTRSHGFASSVMTNTDFNYLIQPEDFKAGANPFMRDLGPYDYYAVRWLYSDGDENPEGKGKELEYISNKSLDVRSSFFALGDNYIESADLFRKNLEYIVKRSKLWLDGPHVTEIFRELFPEWLWLKAYYRYTPVIKLIGGYTVKDGRYAPVSVEMQKKAVEWLLDENSDLSWVDNGRDLRYYGLNSDLSGYLSMNLARAIADAVFGRRAMVDSPLSDTGNLRKELIGLLSDKVLGRISGGSPSRGDLIMFDYVVAYVSSGIVTKPQYNDKGSYLAASLTGDEGLYNPAEGVRYVSDPADRGLYYELLKRAEKAARTGATKCRNRDTADELRLASFRIGKILLGK